MQGVNAESLFIFTTNSRLKEMIRFITKSREINCKNSYVINRLSDILKYEELTIVIRINFNFIDFF